MKPTLIVMAAGMGSRFGGLKQIEPVDEAGRVILDYSVYDALRAGFGRVLLVIKKENEEVFRQTVGARIGRACEPEYVFQTLEDLPRGYTVPEGRVKPWGTAHAVLSCRDTVKEPFAVINADDFYGRGAFEALAAFLSVEGSQNEQCMVGYRLKNTLTEAGTVARGICEADSEGYLLSVTERTKIRGPETAPAFTEDGGATWTALDPNGLVSLNTWGFRFAFMDKIRTDFTAFMNSKMPADPLGAEFFLPGVVNEALAAGTDRVRVLPTEETWHGVTYRQDMPALQAALRTLRERGIYPEKFW